jgi:hypothetical protein
MRAPVFPNPLPLGVVVLFDPETPGQPFRVARYAEGATRGRMLRTCRTRARAVAFANDEAARIGAGLLWLPHATEWGVA